MHVAEIAVHTDLAIPPCATLKEAGAAMREAGTGVLPIVEGGRLVATLSERDLAVKGCGAGLDPRSTRVSALVNGTPAACPGHLPLKAALEEMRRHRQTWLVVLGGEARVSGIVSLVALLEVLEGLVPEEAEGPELNSVRRVRGDGPSAELGA